MLTAMVHLFLSSVQHKVTPHYSVRAEEGQTCSLVAALRNLTGTVR